MRRSVANLNSLKRNIHSLKGDQKDRRTTKTKASNKKPNVFSISLARNKNTKNPTLFGSVKKQPLDQIQIQQFNTQNKQSRQNQQSKQIKQQKSRLKEKNLFFDNNFDNLNNKISIQFINSLYSDILIRFSHKVHQTIDIKDKQNRQFYCNHINITPSKNQKQQQKEIQNLISNLFNIKQNVNKLYKQMENTTNLYIYLQKNHKQLSNLRLQSIGYSNIQGSPVYLHKCINIFLLKFKETQQKLVILQDKYKSIQKQGHNKIKQQIRQQKQNDKQIDDQIRQLKKQLKKQKQLALRLQRQEKQLMNKLYSTQRQNNNLQQSSSLLKIKNVNLQSTHKLSMSLCKKTKQSLSDTLKKPLLRRCLSLKLQKINRYNVFNSPKVQKQKNSTKSISKCQSLVNFPKIQKSSRQNYFNQIH